MRSGFYSFINMNNDRYVEIRNDPDYKVFKFVSEGRHGNLTKIVRFDKLRQRNNTFNLALGTELNDGEVDFTGITNNGDRNKILATVAKIVYTVTEKHPEMDIYVTGSDSRRTLLYQRAIIYAYDELTETFNIYGVLTNDDMIDYEPFDQSKNYLGLLIERKGVNDEQLVY